MTAVMFLSAAVGAIVASFAARALRSRDLERRRYAAAEGLHELRGALAAIQLGTSAVETVLNGDRNPADRSEAIRTQVERAETAIDDLDELLRGQRSRRAAVGERLVDVGELVRRRAAAWDRLAFAKGGRVGLRWELGPTQVAAEPKRLCQALDNLIANGLEHGGGIVTIEGALENGVVRITVSDEGPGFDDSIAGLPRASAAADHGHGLAVVRRAVEGNRGHLRAVSGGHGAEVQIELPLADRPDRLPIAVER